jgi:3-deoxy-D-manno-octulosonic-acid transferase
VTFSSYRLITHIVSPFIALYLLLRRVRGKEDPERLRERFGYPSIQRPSNKLIWIHAASVGEALSVLPLMQCLSDRYADVSLLITTGTVTSAKMVAAKLPSNSYHQYIPVDIPGAVDRFLAHWQPDLALWMESELWPNLITSTARYCPLILLNGRISPRSLKFWQQRPQLCRNMIASFTLFLPQSSRDAEHLRLLGATALGPVGNLKYYAPPLPANPTELHLLGKKVAGRPVWVAASTHHNEEEQCAEVHMRLKADFPDLLTIIIPRHATRGSTIASQLRAKGLTVAVRSLQDSLEKSTDIYLADTMGELGIFYRLAPIVCLGGSLIAHGGQNPLEAARLECAIISGKHIHNFIDIYAELTASNSAIIVQDKDELYSTLKHLLSHPEQQHTLAGNALRAVAVTQHILDNTLTVLAPFIADIPEDKTAPRAANL